jgi:uncharacterized membrane protein
MCLVLLVVFLCVFGGLGFHYYGFSPLQPGCAIAMSPFNSASLMYVVCLGVSVLAKAYDSMKFQSWGDWLKVIKDMLRREGSLE